VTQQVFDGLLPTDGTLYQPLADFYAHHLSQAIDAHWTGLNSGQLGQLKWNADHFASFKAHAVQQALHEQRVDADGVVRSFVDFRVAAQAVHDQYQRYFETELNQAIGGAQMASKWSEFTPGALLRYDTAGDDRVRDDHAIYDGITRPMDDPFWDSHFPPCDWGCRCTVTQVDDNTEVTAAPELRGVPEPPEEFRQNVGKTGEVFGKKHPYFDVPSKVAATIEQQVGPAAGYTRVVVSSKGGYVDMHNSQTGQEAQENLVIAKYVAEHSHQRIRLLELIDRPGVTNPDALIDGSVWEFKTLESGSVNAIDKAIQRGKDQADNLIIHALDTTSAGALQQGIYSRVKRSPLVQTIQLFQKGHMQVFTRAEILSDSFRVK
jgi:SPP1 gp7 family putative phage head morphogenesis protein